MYLQIERKKIKAVYLMERIINYGKNEVHVVGVFRR